MADVVTDPEKVAVEYEGRRIEGWMTAWDRVVTRFRGQRPHVDVWSPTEYRVWLRSGWHVHFGASTSAPVGHGRSLEAACVALLAYVSKPGSRVVKGECDYRCSAAYSGSPASKIAHKSLTKFIEGCAREVETWPAWKRGLPPCAREDCDREYNHPGRHRRPRKGV